MLKKQNPSDFTSVIFVYFFPYFKINGDYVGIFYKVRMLTILFVDY